MTIEVRPFQPGDTSRLAPLLRETAAGYGAMVAPELDVAADLMHRTRSVGFIVASDGERLTGFATFVTAYPVAGLVELLHVQQVYVAIADRRRGIATSLMAGVARIAASRSIPRVEWSTAVGNSAARMLCDGMGAEGTDKVHYVLSGGNLARLATRS